MPPKPKINIPAPGKRFICKFCQKSFAYESKFREHECKQMKRHLEIQTPIGQAAWSYYQFWMRTQHRHISSGITSFLDSKYYISFVKFAKFVQKISLPDVNLYIKLMVQKTMPPPLWMSDEIYAVYLDHLDKKLTPSQHAEISINTLFAYAKKNGLDESEVDQIFDILHPNDLIAMLRERRLSPWLLLQSKSFARMLRDRTTPEQFIIIQTIIHPDVWHDKMAKHPDEVAKMKKYVEALGI